MPSVPKPPPLQDHSAHQMAAEGSSEKGWACSADIQLSSAFARFMGKNVGGRSMDSKIRTRGGRPCLDLGSRSEVLLVHEVNQLQYYSLNTVEYTIARRYLDDDLRSSSASSSYLIELRILIPVHQVLATSACPTSNNVAMVTTLLVSTRLHAAQSPAVDSRLSAMGRLSFIDCVKWMPHIALS